MNKLQTAIADALVKIGPRQSPYGDSILLKEIRSACNIQNKKNATVRVEDLEAAVQFLAENGQGFWSLKLDSVNNILIKKVEGENALYLSAEDKRNRQRSEKSMTLLTEADLKEAGKQGQKKQFKKTKREKFSLDI